MTIAAEWAAGRKKRMSRECLCEEAVSTMNRRVYQCRKCGAVYSKVPLVIRAGGPYCEREEETLP